MHSGWATSALQEQAANPTSIEKYLASKFGDRLDDARAAMAKLAGAHEPGNLDRRGSTCTSGSGARCRKVNRAWGAVGELGDLPASWR